MPIKILHCIPAEKFTEPFIEFVLQNCDPKEHSFIVKQMTAFDVNARPQVMLLPLQTGWLQLLNTYVKAISHSNKVIVHSLFDNKLTLLLALQPWALSKCVWVIWGGDLYGSLRTADTLTGRLLSAIRGFVIRRLGGIVTMIDGDYEIARDHFGTRARRYSSFVYPSNLVPTPSEAPAEHDGINVLLGNSADPSNHHFEVLDQLAALGHSELHVIAPLSYGDKAYAAKVIAYGTKLFGNKFHALEHFMPREEYEILLKGVDIAIFNHDRKQALGNIITLLGMGKKVYIRNTVTHWDFFVNIGISINNITDITPTAHLPEIRERNQRIIEQYFSKAKLQEQLSILFS